MSTWSARLRRANLFWLSVGLICLVAVPVYALLLSVIIRSELLDFGGPPFNDEQFKALIALIGVALGTTATVIGVILTKAAGDRAAAQQEESQRRAEVAERESQAKQKLDTAVQVLNLMKVDNTYAAKAVTGGALTTLVHLGHPVIAMRTLQAALKDDAVDIWTAAWLIDQVLAGTSPTDSRADLAASKQDAAELLLAHVHRLPDDDRPGYVAWPSCAVSSWPSGLDPQTALNVMYALLKVLTSRTASWWVKEDLTWHWIIDTLVAAAEDQTGHEYVRSEAASYATLLLKALDFTAVAPEYAADITGRMDELAHPDDLFNTKLAARVNDWIVSARSGDAPAG